MNTRIEKLIACPRDCYDTCRLVAVVENGKVVLIKPNNDPITKGIGCPRGVKDSLRLYSSSRILYPVENIRKSGIYKRIDWDKALEIIVNKIHEVMEQYGPQTILFLDYAGNRGLINRHGSKRLWNYLRVARIDYTKCDAAGDKALKLIYGTTYGVYPKDMDKLKVIVFWGFNPFSSSIHIWHKAMELRARECTIVVIDVRRSETVKYSDFLQPRPGSDGVLTLGISKYLIDNGKVDMEFIKKYVYGFNLFVKHVEKYSLEFVERVTNILRSEIVKLAELLCEKKPFAIFIGYGLQRGFGGGEIVRAIASIPALLGIHRGFYYSNTDGLPINFSAIEGQDLGLPSRIISMEKVGTYLARGEFKFVYIHLQNPAATLPNALKVIEGLKRNDVFVVVHDTHWSDSARLTNIVLPAPTYLEKLDVVYSYWHNYLYLNEPVIDPLGESLSEYQVMCELAKALKISDFDKVCLDPIELLKLGLGTEVLDMLLKYKVIELKPRPGGEYQTSSGRIELYSLAAERECLPPLPSPPGGETLHENEFLLISSTHRLYTHAQFEDIYGPIPP